MIQVVKSFFALKYEQNKLEQITDIKKYVNIFIHKCCQEETFIFYVCKE